MGLFNTLMGNVSDTDIQSITEQYKSILCENEVIERAFAHIRDKWVFTNKRLIIQNTQGVTGKKKEFFSVPYHAVECFSIETAGTFDEDAELKIWVKGLDGPLEVNFGKGNNILEIERLFAGHVLK